MLLCISEVAVNNSFTNYTSVSTFCSSPLFLGTRELFQGTSPRGFPRCLEGLASILVWIQSVVLADIISYNIIWTIKDLWEPYHLLHESLCFLLLIFFF